MTLPSPPPASGPLLGGRYRLLAEIGRGGMGVVWKARDETDGTLVAVKCLRDPDGGGKAVLRLEREARLLGRLRHPGVVAVLDVGTSDGAPWIVMELVDGEPLPALIPLPPKRALALLIRIAEAVGHVHRQGIVHRDLKPQNVLVVGRLHPKVTDFGVSRLFGAAAGLEPKVTATGELLGTPRFMAPEAFDGAPPDPAMDVYSLGVLLREMICGVPAPPGAALPAELVPTCRRAIALAPGDRYPDANALLDDLWLAAARLAKRGG